jgi:sulfur-oxidizing protein SoxX
MSVLIAALPPSLPGGSARAADATPPSAVEIVGDGIPQPVAATPGDAARGRSLILARDSANCVLCHAVPDPAVRFSGDLGPPLAGVGARLTVPQLRLRVADIIRLNPSTIMPSYYRVDGFGLVAAAYRGKPILKAAEVEDVVAYLATLK